MKNHLFLIWVCIPFVVIISLCSCGNKSVTGADGKVYDSYQAACRNQDFEAAYEWIEKNDGNDDDKDYVFNAEMLYLASLGTEEASNRIVFLLAEYQISGTPVELGAEYFDNNKTYIGAKQYLEGIKRFNNRCDNVLDMAIAQNNKALCNKIIKLYKEDIEYELGYSEGERCNYIWVIPDNYIGGRKPWASKQAAQAKYKKAFGEEVQ